MAHGRRRSRLVGRRSDRGCRCRRGQAVDVCDHVCNYACVKLRRARFSAAHAGRYQVRRRDRIGQPHLVAEGLADELPQRRRVGFPAKTAYVAGYQIRAALDAIAARGRSSEDD